jgi:hypothetical protein
MICDNNDHDWVLEADDGAPSLRCIADGCTTIEYGEESGTTGNVLMADHIDYLLGRIPVHVEITSRHEEVDPEYGCGIEWEEYINLKVRTADEPSVFTDNRCTCCGHHGSFADEDRVEPPPEQLCGKEHQWVLALSHHDGYELECSGRQCHASHKHLVAHDETMSCALSLEPVPVDVQYREDRWPVFYASSGYEIADCWLDVTVKAGAVVDAG